METPLFHAKLTVAIVLQQHAHLRRIFIHNKTACVGCYMARFCTLQDVAAAYDLELDNFIEQLERAVQSNSIKTKKEIQHEGLV